ncbi:LEUCINE-RICH RECEPTOR-LIKE PROTEIN KINASE FAMILY PROTEIN [Salix purpurea]|uniref:non-specific serine/threonine protein kinase n=1 Tax=Salix purpurea TaxID=77065 RepID=A0A9Q0ZEM5_SALPP|nr:LEUCINE-RICH RECEPTOR-LIKE PROTEIN KINASE FAMILY PROTEIN [Salix purpurea]
MFRFLCLIIILFVVSGEEVSPRIVKERISLLSFRSGVVLDPEGALESWNSSGVHVCNWTGVKCNNASDHVVQLDLSGLSLRGRISPALANLSSLLVLDLSRNFFEGHIPAELGDLLQLRQLSLSWNLLGGNIPEELGFLHHLVYLDLGSNRLAGDIPVPLFCNGSSSLEYMDLSNNSLTGEIPLKNECKLVALRFLLLWSNRLVGRVPRALSNSTNLEWLDLESNMLSGELPSEIELELAGNNLHGEIPPIIGDLSTNCVQIHLDENLLYGSIPSHISNLVNLTLLNLSSNLLNALANISHLGLLDLSKNKLTGSIPDTFAHLSQLRRLFLYENQLSGTIPPSLGQCVNLEILDLSRNNISGTIPGEVAGLKSLKLYLNLSSNHLHGPLPLELSKMDMVLAIDLSSNNLSGTIPPQLGSCIALECLNLSGNVLEGPLPSTIGQLPYLKELDVSSNQLSGNIPQSMEASPTLKHLNFSFNRFSGNISSSGAFSSLTIDSFRGNDGLCGEIQGMPSCRRGHVIHISFILPVLLSLFATPLLCMFAYPLVRRSKFRSQTVIFNGGDLEDEDKETKDLKHPRISYRQLIEATGGFSASSLIGSGRFGRVYKGVLQDNTRIAVKMTQCPFSSTDGFLCGSVGYIAPGSSLHEWVKSHYPHKLKPIVDQAVLRCAPSVMQGSYNKICSDVVLELIELGLVCTQNNPSTRPSMLDVASEMGSLKQYLSNLPSQVIEESYPKASAS